MVPGPLSFNIYLRDLLFLIKDIDVCNFADDSTIFICDHSFEKVLNVLEKNAKLTMSYFENNYMKLNKDKCHQLISSFKHEVMWAELRKEVRWGKYENVCWV